MCKTSSGVRRGIVAPSFLFLAGFLALALTAVSPSIADEPPLDVERLAELPPRPVPTRVPRDDTGRASLSQDELIDRLFANEERLELLEQFEASRRHRDGETTRSISFLSAAADEKKAADAKKPEAPKEKKWYDKLTFRGYAQLRFNETVFMDDPSTRPHYVGDSSIRDNQGFLLRRARLILSGDVHENVGVYIQPDFASAVPGSPDANHFLQIRDFYTDLYLNPDKVHRIRVGQSKLPYGWENMQSSSNRLPLDRNDAFNSATRNERDLGAFYYWTPEYAQQIFKFVLDENLKGSGNYGVFGFGAYNGQGGSFQEQNDNLHFISRLTVPYQFENCQIIEAGIQGYVGKYTVLGSSIAPLGVGPAVTPLGTQVDNRQGITDERIGLTFVAYPQPLGFQAEWTVGRGPALNAAQTMVEESELHGGYAMVLYKCETECHGTLFPFARWSYFEGGYKSERNAPEVDINEWELGNEWQINKHAEVTLSYLITDRTNTLALPTGLSYQQFDGHVIRCQFQFNY